MEQLIAMMPIFLTMSIPGLLLLGNSFRQKTGWRRILGLILWVLGIVFLILGLFVLNTRYFATYP